MLGVLDDKIAVNERVAATSRQLGEARFADVVQGSGGRKIRLGDLVETLTRGVAPRYTEDDDALVVLNQKCIRAGRVGLDPARRTESGNVQSGKYLKMNDVLVNSTGAGTLGRVARWAGDIPATVDSHVTIVRFSSDRMNPMCGAFAILAAQPEIESMGEGSTGQTELGRAKLSDLVLAVPAPEKCESIGAGLEVLEARGEAALRESITLAELRDALLPKLMSGEIRVRDAEKVVEDVT
ncbi:restriction endonuclease subunit S [Frankia sp. CiP1_Cm_nod2]|uniref:restriction endonuclease subunit S n=1 Tax=Frankia sp. CiP1_Cm_nod2 TaxID=2897161 RepID=UPI002023D80F